MKIATKLLKKAKSIALISHISPDPDTVGSTLALFACLKQLGKPVDVYCDCIPNQNYNFLEDFKVYKTQPVERFSDYDLVVAVDVPTSEKLGCYLDAFSAHDNTLRIDHHTSSDPFAKTNVVYPYSACALLIFYIAKKLKVKIDENIATCLYLAICGDTGIFRNNNTDGVTFEICSKLFDYGANYRKVYAEFFDKKTVPYLKLTSNALLNAEINDENKYVILKVIISDYEKFGVSLEDYVGNLPQNYLNCGYKIGAILKEKEDGIHCSLRSKFDYDVSKIASVFGGGGHKNASGCVINETMENAKIQVKQAIENYLNSLD